jgi:hypothetical protein
MKRVTSGEPVHDCPVPFRAVSCCFYDLRKHEASGIEDLAITVAGDHPMSLTVRSHLIVARIRFFKQ